MFPMNKKGNELMQNPNEVTIPDDEVDHPVREVLGTVIYLFVAVAIAFLIISLVAQRTIVSGSSMNNTLQSGDNVIVDKLTYRFSNPKRFDVVVFPEPGHPDTEFIKRIIGLPGETIQITPDGTIWIDGKKLKEHYGKETIQDAGIASVPFTLGPNEYFVMGDNRNNSYDSRYEDVGPIQRGALVGRAVCRVYPFNKMKSLVPKNRK